MAENTKKWYVVRAISGKENKIKKYIEDEVLRNGLSHNLAQILIPTEKIYQIRNGKKINKERNFFPGYILIEADLSGEMPHVIRGTNGVIGFLGAEKGGEPLPVRITEVNRILGKVDELAESDEEMTIPFVVGENIKVIDGPFNGFLGSIEKINEEKRKLEVMVKIFGRKQPLELSFLQVEKES